MRGLGAELPDQLGHNYALGPWAFVGIDPAGPWASSCQLWFGVSPVPKREGPGAPSGWLLGRRDRGHPPFCGDRPWRTPIK